MLNSADYYGKRVAVIGSRTISEWLDGQVEHLSKAITSHGGFIVTGGAPGVDQAAIRGANFKAKVYLPWRTYEAISLDQVWDKEVPAESPEAIKHVEHYYNAPVYTLRQGVAKLMLRNFAIVDDSDLVIAFPRYRFSSPSGGTAFGIYLANALRKPIYEYPIDSLSKWDTCPGCGLHQRLWHCGSPFHEMKSYGA